MAVRLLYTNRVMPSTSVLTSSSAADGFPASRLKDESRSLKTRSKLGWNVVAGYNDWLPYWEGGVIKDAYMNAGNYPTATQMATEAARAMNAVPGIANTYSATYSTNTFTVSRASGSATIGLICSGLGSGWTGGRCGWKDLGFSGVDRTGSTSYAAESVAYKSREYWKIDLGSALGVTCGVVIEHNLGASGTLTLQGSSADTAETSWNSSAHGPVTLSGDSTVRLAYFTQESYRYWRLVANDVSSNTSAYTELGLWYFGTYDEPSKNFVTDSHQVAYEDMSSVVLAISGAHWRDARPAARMYSMTWKAIAADRTKLKSWATACPVGACSFVAFDTSTDIVYGFFTRGLSEAPIGRLLWSVTREFREALP